MNYTSREYSDNIRAIESELFNLESDLIYLKQRSDKMEGREELIVYKIISEPLIQGFEPQPHFRFVVINHQNGEPYPVWHATPQYAKFFADEETLNRILPTLKDLLMITESDDVKVTTVGDVYKLLTEALTQKIEYYKYELKKDAQILSEMG